jgi:AMP-polyphosphate phosphotransferase
MAIDLGDFEKGLSAGDDYDAQLAAVQARLARIQAAHIVHDCRSVIIFEGWDAAGKGGIIKRMTAQLDPRYCQVWPIGAPTAEEKARHFLWRFWQKLPGSKQIAVFDRSWYGRVAVERVEGFATEADWKRGFDEINEFEAQLVDNKTNLVKCFVHITQDEQDARLADRLDNPWKRWKTGAEDYRNRAKRADYLEAYADMFAEADTRWAPWKIIDANKKKGARIAALTHIADALEAKVPMEMPDRDPAVIALAQAAFGYEPKNEDKNADAE